MRGMKAPTAPLAPLPDGLQPFDSFEAAARWNAIMFEWATRGWQQWLDMMARWPALETPAAQGEAATIPAATETPPARKVRAVAKPAAARPAATRHPTRPQAATRPPRTRG
jgi:hypothetical protein